MKRIRINNDIRVKVSVSRNGLPENFGTLIEDGLTLLFRHLSYGNVQITPASYTINGGTIDMVITADQVLHSGRYIFLAQYKQINVLNPDGYDTITWDSEAFEIVNSTSQVGGTDPIVTYSVDLYAEIGIGLKGTDGANSFELWVSEPANVGKTIDDYYIWLREPATTAASEVDALMDQVITRVNQSIYAAGQATESAGNAANLAVEKAGIAVSKAELADTAASGANTAKDAALAAAVKADEDVDAFILAATGSVNSAINNANSAKEDALSAADLAVEKAGVAETKANLADSKATAANNAAGAAIAAKDLTVTATTNANNATLAANTAASLANTKAGLADEKATLANNAATNATTVAGNVATAEGLRVIEEGDRVIAEGLREEYITDIRTEFNFYKDLVTVFTIDETMSLLASVPDVVMDEFSIVNGDLILTY